MKILRNTIDSFTVLKNDQQLANDKLKLKSVGNVLDDFSGTVNIKGDVTAECTGNGRALSVGSLIMEGGNLTAIGRSTNDSGLWADQGIVLNTGSIRVDYHPATDPTGAPAAVQTLKNIVINGGTFTVDSKGVKAFGIFANGGSITVNGGILTVEAGAGNHVAVEATQDIKINGGIVNVISENGRGIWGSWVMIESAEVSVKAYKAGVTATDTFRMKRRSDPQKPGPKTMTMRYLSLLPRMHRTKRMRAMYPR